MNISKVSNCYGCMACVDKCPQTCIGVNKDKLGHIVPFVTENKCTDCGLCLKICPSENKSEFESPIQTFAAWRKDEAEREQSSSGGLASVISEIFIKENGIVYGCTFLAPFTFKHIRCETIEDLHLLKGSKYVQSQMKGVYTSINKDLKSGKKVLFIGTPCQVDGVNKYFKERKELYTIDLVCHGVPSVDMLKSSLPPNVVAQNIVQVKFRHNTRYHFSIQNKASIVYDRPINRDLFLKGFFKSLFNRNSCYTCKYARPERISDMTLGDFWGVNTDIIHTDPNKGISLCLINSSKGNFLLNSISDQVEKIERPLSEAISGNKQLIHPMPETNRAKLFKKLYPKIGFKWSVILSIPEIILKNLLFKS